VGENILEVSRGAPAGVLASFNQDEKYNWTASAKSACGHCPSQNMHNPILKSKECSQCILTFDKPANS